VNGPQRGVTAVLRPPRARIGRSRDNDLVLADRAGAESSAHHAEAYREGRQWWIHDLQSTNGTWLNGARVSRAPFGPRDRVQFGDVEFLVLSGRFGRIAGSIAALALAALAVAIYIAMSGRARSFETVAADIARSVYLVALETGDSREIVGTAFVAGEGLLATNAHVAAALNASPPDPRRALVIRSDSGEVHRIARIHISQSWRRDSMAHDVALLAVPDLPANARPLRLADVPTVASLQRGTTVATFGFPAISTDAARPRGRLSVDVLGDVRDGQYLAVGLRIAPGTSGSPIFLSDGVVVGLVTGGDFTITPTGARGPSGTNVNWGISVAPLQQLLRDCAAGRR
jgi:hypothetical protein